MVTRRGILAATASAGIALVTGLTTNFGVGTARAHSVTSSFSVQGDSITTDNGQLQSLTVGASGHVSYDGLDAEAVSVTVNLFAAPSGGATDALGNQVASSTTLVADTADLKAYAGHLNYGFTDVDVLAATDLAASDFSAPTDGTSTSTDVDFRVESLVKDATGTIITESATTATATITVTNQAASANANGSGNTSAQGTNQSP